MNSGSADFDVVIVGAGPAGISAALWCRDLGLSAVVLEKALEIGGQLLSIFNPIGNYLGLSARDGRELSERFEQDVNAAGIPIQTGSKVLGIEPGPVQAVFLEGGRELRAGAVILATGVRRRRLNVPGEDKFASKGILVSGARDRESVAGKIVVIVGGGDAALENAVMLSEHASQVYVVHRANSLKAREEFVRLAAGRSNVEFALQTNVRSIDGDETVRSVSVFRSGTGGTSETRVFPADAVLIRIGVEPNSELYRNKADLDSAGYVLADQLGRTSVAGLYAIGDVANPVSPTIATATGTGASAAKAIAASLLRP